MDVLGKSNIKFTLFRQLKRGEVFCFTKDFNSINPVNVNIWIRCGRTDDDKFAMNLETGIIYSFDGSESVQRVDGTYTIKNPNDK